MGRQKSALQKRDAYQLLVATRRACALASEAFAPSGSGTVRLIIEAEGIGLWDDFVETRLESGLERTHCWQVKRQQTPLAQAAFRELIEEIGDVAHHHFAVPASIELTDVGELRVLQALCARAQQPGAHLPTVVDQASNAEQDWLTFLISARGGSQELATAILSRLTVHFIDLEDAIEEQARAHLAPIFADKSTDALSRLRELLSKVDGAAVVDQSLVKTALSHLLPPKFDSADALYRDLIIEVGKALWLASWDGVSDHLITDMLHVRLAESAAEVPRLRRETRWPGKDKVFEARFENLADRVDSYLEHFLSRCEVRGQVYAEDNSWRRTWLKHEEFERRSKIMQKWQRGNNARLMNLVVALNEFGESAMNYDARVFKRKFGVSDSMGTTSNMRPVIYYPNEYVPL